MSAPLNRRQRGQTFVLGAIGMIAIVGMLAFVIDAGFAFMARLELQKIADAAALAAVGEWVSYPDPDPQYQGETEAAWQTRMAAKMHVTAQQYADRNSAIAMGVCAPAEPPILAVDPVDIVALPAESLQGPSMGSVPSLHVRVTCGVPLIFGRILWQSGQAPTLAVQADATALKGCRDHTGTVLAYMTPCPGPTAAPMTPTPDTHGTRLIG